jgi:ribosomal protein S18 acetylase RimI-like enzyme
MKLVPLSTEMLPELYDLYRRIEIQDEIPILTPWEEIEELAESPHLDLNADGRICHRDGKAVGFCLVMHRLGESDHVRAFLIGGVDSAFRRQGIGASLFRWALDRARTLLQEEGPNLPRYVRTFAFDFEKSAIGLYERHGLQPIRYFAELIRPLDNSIRVRQPDGITVSPWIEDRSDEVRQLINLAFRDHWGSTPRDEEAWSHRMNNVGVRRDLSYVALTDDRVVGAAINLHYPQDQKVTGRLDGWIGTLGTHPDFRKRGIASALIETSCAHFREAGFDHALIGVDSDSLTGAHRLYESLGFQPLHRQVQHQIAV